MRFLTLLLVIAGFILSEQVSAQSVDQEYIDVLSEYAREISSEQDIYQLGETIEDGRRLVLMGEASHGTSEFYRYRAELSKYLIEEKGFRFIAVEGDWPAAKRVNQYVKHREGGPDTAEEALEYFDRWPLWMWRNQEVLELVEWMRDFNEDRPEEDRAGFYGVDMYDKDRAMETVIRHAEGFDGEKAAEIQQAYECLQAHHSPQAYIQSIQQTGSNCESEMAGVVDLLEEHQQAWMDSDSVAYADAYQSAWAAKRAEQHYRANLQPGPDSWNYRANHFYETAERLLQGYGEESRGIVWAHNTHIGDARATDMQQQRMQNIGQLARENLGADQVFAVGFSTYTGQVFAGLEWEGDRQLLDVPEAISHSLDDLMERVGYEAFFLPMHLHEGIADQLTQPRGHRAMGVVYDPDQETQQNYVNTVLPERYDAFIFIRQTTHLDPLDDE